MKTLTETYDGLACKRCQNTLRYKQNKSCVYCRTERNRSPERKAYLSDYEKLEKRRKYKSILNQTEKIKIYKRISNQRPESIALNKAWHKTPKGKASLRVASQNIRSKRRQAEGSHTTQEWLILKEQCGNICLSCRKYELELDRPLEQDHIIPLSKGGSNWISNIQPLCRDCNGMGRKGTKIINFRESPTAHS